MAKTDYEKFEKSLENLKGQYENYLNIEKQGLSEVTKQAVKNSVVKCFEICYDTLWKHLKKRLQEEHPKVPNSPMGIFRMAFENDLIDEGMQERLQDYNELRIQSSYDYNMEKGHIVLDKTGDFIEDAAELHKTLSETE